MGNKQFDFEIIPSMAKSQALNWRSDSLNNPKCCLFLSKWYHHSPSICLNLWNSRKLLGEDINTTITTWFQHLQTCFFFWSQVCKDDHKKQDMWSWQSTINVCFVNVLFVCWLPYVHKFFPLRERKGNHHPTTAPLQLASPQETDLIVGRFVRYHRRFNREEK